MLYMQIKSTLNRRRRSDVDRRRETDVEQTLFQRCFIIIINYRINFNKFNYYSELFSG